MVLSIWDFIETRDEDIENIDIDDEIDAFDIFESEEEEKDRSRRAIRRSKNRTKQKRMVRELGVNSIVPSDTDKRKMLVCSKKMIEFNNSVRRYNRRPKDTESVRRYMSGEWYADIDSVDSEDISFVEEPEIRVFDGWDLVAAVTHLRDEAYGDQFRSFTTTEHYRWTEVVKRLMNMIEAHSLQIWSKDGEIVFTSDEPLNGDMARLLAIVLEVFEWWS